MSRHAAPLPLLALLTSVLPASEARAQRPDAAPAAAVVSLLPVAPGTRVRLSGGELRVTGVLVAWRDDTLLIHLDRTHEAQPVPLPLTAIRRLEVSRGQRTLGDRALRAAVPGLFLGAVAGGFAGHAITDRGDCQDCELRGVGVLIGVPVGAGAGALLGGLVGALRGSERWDGLDARTKRLAERRTP